MSAAAYQWVKSLHLVSVILWMGVQMLLPTLLLAHRALPSSSPEAALLARIERQLIKFVMNPAMIAAFLFGALLANAVHEATGRIPGWLGVKFGLVIVLSALHGKLLRQSWHAADGGMQWGVRRYRCVQWLGYVLLAGVVVLATTKPWL